MRSCGPTTIISQELSWLPDMAGRQKFFASQIAGDLVDERAYKFGTTERA